jgi:predicted transposase/invertase (TIGR01784 family)
VSGTKRDEGREQGHEERLEEGIEKGRALVKQEVLKRLQSHGQTLKQISELMGLSLAEVRRLASR